MITDEQCPEAKKRTGAQPNRPTYMKKPASSAETERNTTGNRFGKVDQNSFLRFDDARIPIISRYFATVRRAILIPSFSFRSSTIA